MTLKDILILVSFGIIAVFGTKCQQSLQYKEYKLHGSAVTIKDTKTNIKNRGICAALAVRENYPSFMYNEEEDKCELAVVDMGKHGESHR